VDARIAASRDGPVPEGVTAPVEALWHVARGAWDTAHELVQDDSSRDAAWVHAHVHRVEGDLSNAAYWYGMAGQPVARDAIDAEWRRLVSVLIARPAESP
jgi:hypothetical protein